MITSLLYNRGFEEVRVVIHVYISAYEYSQIESEISFIVNKKIENEKQLSMYSKITIIFISADE